MSERRTFPGKFFVTSQFETFRADIAASAEVGLKPMLDTLSRDGATQTSETFREVSKSRYFNLVDFFPLQDGLALVWNTEDFLEYRHHRLIFRDDGDLMYYRSSYFEDCQKIPSPILDIVGREEVLSQNEAITGMLYASDLLDIANHGRVV